MPRRAASLFAGLWSLALSGTVPAQAPIAQVVFLPQETLTKPPEKLPPDKKTPDKKEADKKPPASDPEVAKPVDPAPKKEEECKDTSIFAKMPPIARFPKPGNPLNAPAAVPGMGSGYFSVKDCICHHILDKPPKYPYPRFSIIPQSFYDFDWRYPDKPDNQEHDFFDCLKR